MNKRFIVAACLIAAPIAASAQANPWDAPYSISIGLFHADAETSLRLDGEGGRFGTQVSFEGDLGGEKRKTLPSFDFAWRFNPRHALEGSVLSLRREGDATLAGTINWGEISFPVNTRINSEFNSDIVRVAYRYSPWHDNNMEVGLLIGVHYTRLQTSISSAEDTA